MAADNAPIGTRIYPPAVELPAFATRYVNLANADLGAKVLTCTDDFFAAADRMLQASEPVFVVGEYDKNGKWMDGWESKRRRNGGYDHAVVRLGLPGIVRGVDIDTSHFTGNYPPAAMLEGCSSAGDPTADADWFPLVPAASLGPSARHFVAVSCEQVVSHVRLNIYPDGGVARLRVYGEPHRDWSRTASDELIELSALQNGGRVMAWNNAHYGMPWRLVMPGRGVNMGDGWETRRRREPGNDWCIVALGHRGIIERVEIDTAHFKGNYPDRASLQAADVQYGTDQSIVTQAMFWPQLMGEQKLQMDHQHFFDAGALTALGPVSHIKLNIFPDGGVSRLRVWGRLAR
jgi:allantoicase